MNKTSPLLTDLYQISMSYSYWKSSMHNNTATFELYFRTCPFGGEYVVVGGIEKSIEFIKKYSFTDEEIHQLKNHFLNYDDDFFNYLKTINSKSLKVRAIPDGSIVFPNTPIIQITGPIIVCQLLETTLLNITGHPTLITTYARRIKQCAKNKKLVEFGLRRAQGESAGMNSSLYSWIGGFDGTSNVLAGLEYEIPIVGTHAHSYIMSFTGLEEVKNNLKIKNLKTNEYIDNFKKYVFEINDLDELNIKTNKSELAAFITYAWTQPTSFLALIDTFDTILSGLENYCAIANALIQLGYQPRGVRLDSGDLAQLSVKIKEKFVLMSNIYTEYVNMIIVVSNNLDEHTIKSIVDQNSPIDMFGIGTKLSTSHKSPALGMVYKLVKIDNIPRIKFSENIEKITIPCKKHILRLYDSNSVAMLDLLTLSADINEYMDDNGFISYVDRKQATEFKIKYYSHKELLVDMLIENEQYNISSINESKFRCENDINLISSEQLKYSNPIPYKVCISNSLNKIIKNIISIEHNL